MKLSDQLSWGVRNRIKLGTVACKQCIPVFIDLNSNKLKLSDKFQHTREVKNTVTVPEVPLLRCFTYYWTVQCLCKERRMTASFCLSFCRSNKVVQYNKNNSVIIHITSYLCE